MFIQKRFLQCILIILHGLEDMMKKYFFDTGAYLQCAYPIVGKVLMWYYPMRLYKKSKLKN